MFLHKPTAGQQGRGQRLQQINESCWRFIVPAGFFTHAAESLGFVKTQISAHAEGVSEPRSRKEAQRQVSTDLAFPALVRGEGETGTCCMSARWCVHTQVDNGLVIRLMETWANLTKRRFPFAQCHWMYGCVVQARLKFLRLPQSSTGRRASCLMGSGETMGSRIAIPFIYIWKQRWTRCSSRDVFCLRLCLFGASHLGC